MTAPLHQAPDADEGLTLGDRVRLRWWQTLAWFRRCPECRRRGYGNQAPRWDQDPIAHMLGGVTPERCPCCGKKASA